MKERSWENYMREQQKNGEQFADSRIVSRQELIEFLPDDYRVDLDGSEYILRLIRIGQAGSRGSALALEQGIVEPTALPEFTNIRCMGAEHKRLRNAAEDSLQAFKSGTFLEEL